VQDISSKTGRSYYHSSSFKLAVFFSVVLGFGVMVMGYFGYYFSHGHFVNSTQALLEKDIAWFGDIKDPEALRDSVIQHSNTADHIYLLMDNVGQKLAGNLDAVPKDISPLAEGTITFPLGPENRQFAARIETLPDNRRLLVGVEITEDARDFARMQALSIVAILCMALVIITSFRVSTFVVSRTNRIARTAKAIIDTGDMTRRIAIDSKWDDLSYMADVLNEFLTRNEQLLKGIKQVSDNIAHDLRTPLTRLRNNLDTMRRDIRDNDAMAARCDSLLSEADHLLDTFAALMRIAHVETGSRRTHFKPVDMLKLVQDVIELYEPLAEDKHIRLSFSGKATQLTGDPDLLFQALANLLDNAIKFTPHNGHVEVQLEATGRMVSVTVKDSGPGICDDDAPRVFERFYRADMCRNSPGNGLGLALVSAVIELHHGKIKLANLNPGLSVTVVLPA